MKKILIIILTLLLCTGCFDYKEINDLAIINAIGVDYENDEYVITLEILNDQIDKDSSKITSYTKVGHGKNLTSAIENAADKLSKQLIFNHIKLMILSKSIIDEKFENIIDLFLRNTYFRENFYVISATKNKPETLLNHTTNEAPIASTAITDTLESIRYSSNTNVLKKFDEIVEEVITYGIDTCFSNITLKNDEFIVDGMAIFNNYDYIGNLDNEYVKIYNLLTDNFDRPTYTINYDNLSFTTAINNGKINTEIKSGTINVNGNLMGRIIDNDPKYNIRDPKNLERIDNDFTNLLNKKISEFIKVLQDNNSDILGITKNYYKKTRTKDKDYWLKLDIKSNIKFNINKKGLIYDVERESWKRIIVYLYISYHTFFF